MVKLVDEGYQWKFIADTQELKRLIELGCVSPEGIIFHEELAGREGMDFILFPASHHSPEDVRDTKDWIRGNRDAVHIYIGRPIGEYPLQRFHPVWTAERKEAGFREIVSSKSYMAIDNCVLVDLFTATHMVQVLDALNPVNKAKMLSYSAALMIEIMWKMLDRE